MNILKIIIPTFVLFLLVRLGFYFNDNNDGVLVSSIFRKYVVIEEIISSIFSLSIFIYAFKIYKSVRGLKEQNDINNFDNLKWIGGFFTLGLLVYIFWFIPLLITIVFDFKVFMPSYYPLRVFTTILIYWLGYQSVLQLRVLKERKYLRKHLTKPSNLSSNNEVLDKKIKNEIHISQEVVDSILKGLEDFENEKQYTLQSITLNSLAKKLNTNTNYLSKVVNHYKEMSYTNYLNTLRINNIVEELYSNPKIRKFTIKAIAQEAGYSNSDSFSKVFYKLKGENPSEFIKKLK
ncbi:helix-turn-helix domain-containing protein [uncultured Tenacibaculum sp.]|uniref:helix-turn-helix domain-containing protein n=1 Tax=uncultured Tenacibaculum sp. TaxID=174713 RepID=UPI0026254116|nr:helix-turn-helix domain-containing protein [uncultured Tenacibaculum sp.]